jgi:Thioesterase-like superfamily
VSTAFEAATAARKIEDGRYAIDIDPAWAVGGIANGGYLLSTVLRAVLADSPHPHPVATSAHYLARPVSGPAEVTVAPLRTGRVATALQATLRQDSRPRMVALVTAATLTPKAKPDWVGVPPAEVAPVEQCVAARADLPDGSHIPLFKHVDLRLDPATVGWFAGHPAGVLEMRGHVRLAGGDEPSPLVLPLAVDALPPTVFGLGMLGWAPTIELTCHVRALPAPGWLTCQLRGRLVQDGWFDEEAEVYDSRGQLVAQSRQLARVNVTRTLPGGWQGTKATR